MLASSGETARSVKVAMPARAPQNQAQETAISVQLVPAMRFLVIDFGALRKRITGHLVAAWNTVCQYQTARRPIAEVLYRLRLRLRSSLRAGSSVR
eukprot:2867045-Rhodomonas_salina.1